MRETTYDSSHLLLGPDLYLHFHSDMHFARHYRMLSVIIALTVTISSSLPAWSEPGVQVIEVEAESDTTCTPKVLHRISNYLNNFKTLQGDFRQTGELGEASKRGKLYIQKPNYLMWQYSSPTKDFLLVRDKEVIYHDHELQETSHIPAANVSYYTLLASKNIDVSKDVKVKYCNSTDKEIRLTIADSEIQDPLHFVFVFQNNPIALKEILTIENHVMISKIEFETLLYNTRIAKGIFSFKDPKFFSSPYEVQ